MSVEENSIFINRIEFEAEEAATFTEESVEDGEETSSSWTLTSLQCAEQEELWFLEESDVSADIRFLYMPCDEDIPWEDAEDLLEKDVSIESSLEYLSDGSDVYMRGEIDAPALTEHLEAPFTGTSMFAQFGSQSFYATLVCKEDLTNVERKEESEVFYSLSFPASKMEREPLPCLKPVESPVINYLPSLLLAAAAAFYIFSGIPRSFELYEALWGVGLVGFFLRMKSRDFVLYRTSHIVSNALFLYIATLYIDKLNRVSFGESLAFQWQSYRLIGFLVGLVVLHAFARKLYYMISDAALWSGMISLVVYVCGILIASLSEEYWYGRDFTWYLTDWSLFWSLSFVACLVAMFIDYKAVPMTVKAVIEQLRDLQEHLRGDIRDIAKHAKKLKVIVDDIGDAISISDLAPITSLEAYTNQFRMLSNKIGLLEKVSGEAFFDLEALYRDFEILNQDLDELIDMIQDPNRGSYTKLRISPQLRIVADYENEQDDED